MKILIADDNTENRYLLEVLLKGNGYDIQCVSNGAEALIELKSNRIDLVISDILMPVMDGFELCRKIRSDEDLHSIPFIIYTSTYTGPQDESFAIKIGADCFIQKPCEPDIFMETVRNVMSAGRKDTGLMTEPPEEEVLKLYNERLVRKLEQKMMQLEKEVRSRQEAEKILQQSEKKYRSLYNSIRDAILVTDIHRIIIDCNSAAVDLFGYSLDEIVGKKIHIVYENEEEFKQMAIALKDHIDDVNFLHAINFRKKDGSVFPGEVNVFYLRDDDGVLTGFIGLTRDITERKRAEKIRIDLESQLQQAQKMEAIGQLAGGIAHDFNNLLSIILGYSEMTMQDLEQGHPNYEMLDQIHQAGVRAKSLTQQLLAFSRKQILEMKLTDVNQVLAGFEKLLRRLIAEDIELKLLLAPSKLPIMADGAQLEQVLMNLAVNARDAMPEGGTLTIETAVNYLDETYTSEKTDVKPGNYAMIAVSDTGTGMTREILDRIFDPFFTTKEKEKGMGLGLATSYGIIKQHGGNIWVYSEPGKGTVFKIYLPMCAVNPATVEGPSVTYYKPVIGSPVVLLIEDDPSVKKLAGRILSGCEYIVIESINAADAVRIAETEKGRIDIVLTDVIMPGIKGPDLYDKIHVHHPEARVLYMSGYTDNMIVHHGMLNEGIAYIQKPFTAKSLVDKCRQVLSNG